jgi:hypothetical protein
VVSEPSRFQQLMSWWKQQPQSESPRVTGQKFLGRYGQEGVGELPQFYQQEKVERPQIPMDFAQRERLAQWEQRKKEIAAEVAREMERGKAIKAEVGPVEYERRLRNLSNALGEANRTYDRVIREEELKKNLEHELQHTGPNAGIEEAIRQTELRQAAAAGLAEQEVEQAKMSEAAAGFAAQEAAEDQARQKANEERWARKSQEEKDDYEQAAKEFEQRRALQERYYEQFGIPRHQYLEIENLHQAAPLTRSEE